MDRPVDGRYRKPQHASLTLSEEFLALELALLLQG